VTQVQETAVEYAVATRHFVRCNRSYNDTCMSVVIIMILRTQTHTRRALCHVSVTLLCIELHFQTAAFFGCATCIVMRKQLGLVILASLVALLLLNIYGNYARALSDRLSCLKISETSSQLPRGYSKSSVNTVIFRKNSIASWNGSQLMAYYSGSEQVVLASRRLLPTPSNWSWMIGKYTGKATDAHNCIR
jgi:hypothetical protein